MKKLFILLIILTCGFRYSYAIFPSLNSSVETSPILESYDITLWVNGEPSTRDITKVPDAYISNYFKLSTYHGNTFYVNSDGDIVFTIVLPTDQLPEFPVCPILTTPDGLSNWKMELKSSHVDMTSYYTYFEYTIHIKYINVLTEFSLVLADETDYSKEFFVLYAYDFKFDYLPE